MSFCCFNVIGLATTSFLREGTYTLKSFFKEDSFSKKSLVGELFIFSTYHSRLHTLVYIALGNLIYPPLNY